MTGTTASLSWQATGIFRIDVRPSMPSLQPLKGGPHVKPVTTMAIDPALMKDLVATVTAAGMAEDVHVFYATLLAAVREEMLGLRVSVPRREYTLAEAEALERGGGNLAAGLDVVNKVVARTSAKHARIIATGKSVEEVAHMMDVTNGRVRQLLGRRGLYGIKMHGAWCLPAFQFYNDRPIPGIEHVFPQLAPDLSLVAVYNWFTRPNPDLVDDDAPSMSPRDWLISGHPAGHLAALAAEL